MIHDLPCPVPVFEQIASGARSFDVRRNDHGFQKGDQLRLREWQPPKSMHSTGRFTKREQLVEVVFVLSGVGLQPEFVVLGLRHLPAEGQP